MKHICTYDWSKLDRNFLISVIKSARKELTETVSNRTFTKIIRNQLKQYNIPVKLKSNFDDDISENRVAIGGLFESYADKKKKKSITLVLHYKSKKTTILLNSQNLQKFSAEIADTILHEIIHLRQYRRRNYKEIQGFQSHAESRKKQLEQEYLGHTDEIDAYAFNISCELTDIFHGSKKEIISYINKNKLNDNRLKKTTYRMYLKAFDYNHSHCIIKKLKKRIIHYLPYAEIGKPYKTTDWLK